MYDILLDDAQARPAMLARAEAGTVRAHDSFVAAASGAELNSFPRLRPLNRATCLRSRVSICAQARSSSTSTRFRRGRSNRAAVPESSGADFVSRRDGARPAIPLKVPMLLGGRRAAASAQSSRARHERAGHLERNRRGVCVKMCRSVVIKGIEALASEVARTLEDAGLAPAMATATAELQDVRRRDARSAAWHISKKRSFLAQAADALSK